MSKRDTELEECVELMGTDAARKVLEKQWFPPVGIVTASAFPVDCLPDKLREFAMADAKANQLSADMVCVFLLECSEWFVLAALQKESWKNLCSCTSAA